MHKNVVWQSLLSDLTADPIIHEECEMTQTLYEFMINFIAGPDISIKNLDDATLNIKLICTDII